MNREINLENMEIFRDIRELIGWAQRTSLQLDHMEIVLVNRYFVRATSEINRGKVSYCDIMVVLYYKSSYFIF